MAENQPPTELEQARTAARRLLKKLEIKKTVVVDDQAVPGPENMLAAYGSNRKKAPFPKEIAWDELDDEAWRQQARSYFEGLDSEQKRKLNRRALKELGARHGGATDLDLLQQLLGVDETLLLLPDEWQAKKAALTATEGAPENLLVLFDRNLGAGHADGGVSLLEMYLTEQPGARAALLTDTITPNQELSEVEHITRNAPEIRQRTLLASKANLTPTGALEFLNVMRLTANVPTLISVQQRFLNAMDEHHTTAKEQFAQLQPRVLEDIVFRSSHTEGAWEFDTLLRLITLFQEQAMRKGIPDESGAEDIPALLAKTRALIDPIYPDYEPSLSLARKIMAAERWASSGYINQLGLPLANGDIFAISSKYYILMCQPCDLVLRADGRRKACSTVTLLQLKPLAASPEEVTPELSNQRRYHDLPLGFEHEPPEGFAVIFAPWYDVDVAVLDLCTFRSDGMAIMDLADNETNVPAALTDGVSARHKAVRDIVARRLKLAAACGELEAHREVRRDLLRADRGDLLPPDLNRLTDDRLVYKCQRTGRLAPPFADAALTALASERAREAHEHDLDRFGNPTARASAPR
ncbi:MAG: hypothetical protein ABSG95_15470 [Solirubrobacteraceae bacterium]|jgi:hypothetical protein